MENKVKIIVKPCKKEEYSIKITFKDKEEMVKFLNKEDQEEKELKELRLQNEHLKKENASYEVQVQAWSEECELRFLKLKEQPKKFVNDFKELLQCGLSMTDKSGTWHMESKIYSILDEIVKKEV